MSQPADGEAKGCGACSLEIVEKQAQGWAILVLEVVSGIHFKHIFSKFTHFYRILPKAVGKPKGSKKVINHWEKEKMLSPCVNWCMVWVKIGDWNEKKYDCWKYGTLDVSEGVCPGRGQSASNTEHSVLYGMGGNPSTDTWNFISRLHGDQIVWNNLFTTGESLYIEFANRLLFKIRPMVYIVKILSIYIYIYKIRLNDCVMNA